MYKEMLAEMLKDATNQLRMAGELMPELTSKDKAQLHVEMAKAYALASIAVSLNCADIAPETVAETKKQKEEFVDPGHEMLDEVMETPAQEAPVQVADAPIAQEPVQDEMPLISVIDNTWIQFNKPVIFNDFDYSAWFMNYVNAIDENNQPLVGADWANQCVTSFTGGCLNSVEDLNDDNIMAFLEFVLRAIEAANQ